MKKLIIIKKNMKEIKTDLFKLIIQSSIKILMIK